MWGQNVNEIPRPKNILGSVVFAVTIVIIEVGNCISVRLVLSAEVVHVGFGF